MSKTKELSIDITLWVDAVEIIDFKDVVLSKLNVKVESMMINTTLQTMLSSIMTVVFGWLLVISKVILVLITVLVIWSCYSRAMSKKQCTIKCGKVVFMLLDVAV